MTNADIFHLAFNMYATELWSKPEEEFLEWLNTERNDVMVTNADKVRSKTDREIAWLLFAYAHKGRRIKFKDILKWLKEEAK